MALVSNKVTCQQICRLSDEVQLTSPGSCCKCIDQNAACNPEEEEYLGYNCNEVDYDYEDLSCRLNTDNQGLSIEISDPLGLRHAEKGDQCTEGLKLCCNPLPRGIIENEIVTQYGQEDKYILPFSTLCDSSPAVAAIQNFSKGIACGKRDSRVYYNYVNASKTETNPGEFPWVVAIFEKAIDPLNGKRKFLSSGSLMDRDVVATVAHNVIPFQDRPQDLIVLLGDWDLRFDYTNKYTFGEEFPHLELDIQCIKIHPEADVTNTLANNVAVLKLDVPTIQSSKTVSDVISLKQAQLTPANQPEAIATGLLERTPTEGNCEYPRTYINTICLPMNEDQFADYTDECYVAAWGSDPFTQPGQREVHLPLMSRQECNQRLEPEFSSRGVKGWVMKQSEICAGPDDTCKGEGGAPLVCLDKKRDQFFAVGLVNYGFGCGGPSPSVFVNLADPVVKNFIIDAFSNEQFCKIK